MKFSFQSFLFSFKIKLISFLLVSIVIINIITIIPIISAASYEPQYSKIESLLKWNNIVTKITSEERLPPPTISRIYALMHVSIYDSLVVAQNENINSKYFDIVLSYAAYTVLNYLFPAYSNEITLIRDNSFSPIANKDISIKDMETSKMTGINVGEEVIDYAKNDNSDAAWDNKIPKGDDCVWHGANPVLPMTGYWKTYILESGAEVQPIPPFTCNSLQDIKELDIVFQAAMNLTPEQITAVHYWGDRSPPIIWNEIMTEYINIYHLDLFDAAYLSAYLHVGLYDAFVSTWYTKYDYWTARPDQRIQDFETIIPTPNFPSYTSGHTIISNVAAKILGEFFYQDKNYFEELANEASLSRLWGGIHFLQDIIQGEVQGLRIGEKITHDMNLPIHTFIANMKENNNQHSYY